MPTGRGPEPGSGWSTRARPWPTPIQSYAGHAIVASKVMPTIEEPLGHQGPACHGQRLQGVGRDLDCLRHVGPRPVEKLAAEQRLGVAVGDGVHHAVQAVDVLADRVGEAGEVVVVGHVELQHGRFGRQPLGDPPGDAERAAEVGDQHGRALLLRDPGDREADRAVHGDAGDQDPLAVENAHVPVPHSESAVDRDHGPGDVGRAVRRQPGDRRGDLFGRSVTPERHLCLVRRLERRRSGCRSCRSPRTPARRRSR